MIFICILFSFFSPLFPKSGWYSIPYSLNYKLKVIDLKDVEEQVQKKDTAQSNSPFSFDRKVKSIEIIAEENWFSAIGHISKEHTIKILEF